MAETLNRKRVRHSDGPFSSLDGPYYRVWVEVDPAKGPNRTWDPNETQTKDKINA